MFQHVSDHKDPSSGSFIQCLAKITVMVLSCPLAWTWSVLWQYICPWCVCVLHCLERHCIKLPDDGSLLIRNTLEHFIYF